MIVRLGTKVQNARKVNILYFVFIRYLITIYMYYKSFSFLIVMFEMSKNNVIHFCFVPLLIYSVYIYNVFLSLKV